MSYVILKFDDLNEETLGSFEAAWEICKRYGAVPCFGLIGSSLERSSEPYLSSLKRMRDAGVELWNHGYFHSEEEFSKCTYQQQKESIEMTQLLMAKHLGDRARTFGSPHNNSTEKTVQVLSENFPEIRNWFFMADGEGRSNARTLLMRCNYEIKTGKVDLDFFRKEYDRIKDYPYFIMQGHPSFWEDEDARKFEEIMKILSLDCNEFVTAEGLRNKSMPDYQDSSIQGLIDSLTDFYVSHDKVYYYGAGEIGREVYRYFSLKGMTPDAFIVSDGHRDTPEVCGKPVLEFGEVYGSSEECGIIPTILGRSHVSVFSDERFQHVDLWMPETVDLYDRMIDHIRFDRCCLWGL